MKKIYNTPTIARKAEVVPATRLIQPGGGDSNGQPFEAGSIGFML